VRENRTNSLVVRRGQQEDLESIAQLAVEAAGDVVEFMAGAFGSRASAIDIYRSMVGEPNGVFSFSRCLVATVNGSIIGFANAFPAILLKDELPIGQLSERELHLSSRTNLNDWDSYLLNNISVERSFRRCGVGAALIDSVFVGATCQGFRSITLHVWADNLHAIRLYKRLGFKQIAHADIPWRLDLPHDGGSLLLRRKLRRRNLNSCLAGDVRN
jgi:ribosomal protein S18 acetylase RimI-like enzyme